MCEFHRGKISNLLLSSLTLLATAHPLLGQCYTPWASRTVLSDTANGQVGLAALGSNLVVTWGERNTNYFRSAVYSSTTQQWSYSAAQTQLPQVLPSVTPGTQLTQGNGGVNMTASTSCGGFYAAYMEPGAGASGNTVIIEAATSSDGIHWTGSPIVSWNSPYATVLPSPTEWSPNPPIETFPSAAPALYGMNSQIINFAFPEYFGKAEQYQWNKGSDSYTYTYTAQMGQFGCGLQNVQVYTPTCTGTDSDFFKVGGTCWGDSYDIWEWDEGFKDGSLSGPWSPLWTGAVYDNSVVQLRAEAQGNSLGNQSPPIWYSVTSIQGGFPLCVGLDCSPANAHEQGAWTNNGVGGAVNPADGTAWLTYTCSYFDSDTCEGTPYFSLVHETSTGESSCGMKGGSGEVAYSMPAMTFWNNQLWLAWHSTSDQIIVASIAPSNIGWNGLPPSCLGNGQSCTSGSQCCSGTCWEGSCHTPCLQNGQSCSSNVQCCSGDCFNLTACVQ